jgi:hypothetical protein
MWFINDAVCSSNYIAPNEWMISKFKWIEKEAVMA